MIQNFLLCARGIWHDNRFDSLILIGRRYADDDDFIHFRMFLQKYLNTARINLVATLVDEELLPANEVETTFCVHSPQIAGEEIAGDPVKKASELLLKGNVVAVKGLGGYHLAVNPLIDKAVKRLRKRKRRPSKPFALMARDISTAKDFCVIDLEAENLLTSFESPIVLLKKSAVAASLSKDVAPDTDWLGIMLPYTPLHHILLREGPQILVMTSANISEEPLVFRDEDAIRQAILETRSLPHRK